MDMDHGILSLSRLDAVYQRSEGAGGITTGLSLSMLHDRAAPLEDRRRLESAPGRLTHQGRAYHAQWDKGGQQGVLSGGVTGLSV
jgi:hypothetical protein